MPAATAPPSPACAGRETAVNDAVVTLKAIRVLMGRPQSAGMYPPKARPSPARHVLAERRLKRIRTSWTECFLSIAARMRRRRCGDAQSQKVSDWSTQSALVASHIRGVGLDCQSFLGESFMGAAMKRIVILIDGTWNEEGIGRDTNIAKFDPAYGNTPLI